MKKLCELVDIIENNMECVLLQVKKDSRLDLIKIGCFYGNEEMIRVTKGANHTFTIFDKNGTSFSWNWGESGYTLVDNNTNNIRKLVYKCITEDFDIYMGADIQKIKGSLHIKSLADTENVIHELDIMYWKNNCNNICVHKNGEYYDHFTSVEVAKTHFEELGYTLQALRNYVAQTGCIVEKYRISKK